MSACAESPTLRRINRMKEWVVDKLQRNISIDNPEFDVDRKRSSLSAPVPKIVICDENSKVPKTRSSRPNPLQKTWVTYDLESPATNLCPTGNTNQQTVTHDRHISAKKSMDDSYDVHLDSSVRKEPGKAAYQKTWLNYSPHSPLGYQISQNMSSESNNDSIDKPFRSPRSKNDVTKPATYKYDVINQQNLDNSSPKTPVTPSTPHSASSVSSKSLKRSTLDVSRSPISPDDMESQSRYRAWSIDSKYQKRLPRKKQIMRNCNSHIDLPETMKTEVSFHSKAVLSAAKERSSSLTHSIQRSLSVNLDIWKRTRGASVRSDGGKYRQKASFINDIEEKPDFKHERRRSSTLKFFCFETQDGDDDEDKFEEQAQIQLLTRANSSETCKSSQESINHLTPGGTAYLENIRNGVHIGGLSSMFDLNKVPSEWGAIKIRFQYFDKTKRFQVSLLRGSNIGTGIDTELKMFVKVTLLPGKKHMRGEGFHDTVNPVFYETFNFRRLNLGDLFDKRLRVKFYNKQNMCSSPMPLGEAVISLFNYDLTAETMIWRHLKRCSGQTVSTTL